MTACNKNRWNDRLENHSNNPERLETRVKNTLKSNISLTKTRKDNLKLENPCRAD